MNFQKIERPSPNNLKSAIDQLIKGRELANRLGVVLRGEAQINAEPNSVPKQLTRELMGTLSKAIAALSAGAKQEEIDGKENSGGTNNGTIQSPPSRGYRTRSNPGSYARKVAKTLEDGHSWRKYGQKEIHNSKYSRNYFRCTHKFDRGCKATRQVQRSEDDPSMFVMTYFGEHTCGDPMEILSSSCPQGEHSCIIDFGSSAKVASEHRNPKSALSKQEPREEVVSNHPSPLISSSLETCLELSGLEEFVGVKDCSDATSEPMQSLPGDYLGGDLTGQSFEFGDFCSLEDDGFLREALWEY